MRISAHALVPEASDSAGSPLRSGGTADSVTCCETARHGGSLPSRAVAIDVGRAMGHDSLPRSAVEIEADPVMLSDEGGRQLEWSAAPLHGLAPAAGERGVARALGIVRDELRLCLGLLGCPSVGELDRSFLAEAER